MVGWHHRLNGHEFEQVPGVGDRQGRLVCCSPWDCKESDMTEQPTLPTPVFLGFPCGSAGKESACSVRDLSLITELRRYPGEGKG